MGTSQLALLSQIAPAWLAPLFMADDVESCCHPSGAVSVCRRQSAEPASETWLHTVYPGLDNAFLRNLEEDYGLRVSNPDALKMGLRAVTGYRGPIPPIPQPYKDFLSRVNGARLFGGHLNLFGVRTMVGGTPLENRQPYELADENVFRRASWQPPDCLKVGGYRWDGTSIFMKHDGSVVVIDPTRAAVVSRPTLDLLMTEEVARLRKRFDERGVLTEPDRPTTPSRSR